MVYLLREEIPNMQEHYSVSTDTWNILILKKHSSLSKLHIGSIPWLCLSCSHQPLASFPLFNPAPRNQDRILIHIGGKKIKTLSGKLQIRSNTIWQTCSARITNITIWPEDQVHCKYHLHTHVVTDRYQCAGCNEN